MIDFQVAYDKLAQFQTADEIAEFLESEGVKAHRGFPDSCAISVYMRALTGEPVFTNINSVSLLINGRGLPHTNAMRSFVPRFDHGDYPNLVAEDDYYTRVIENKCA